MPHLSNTLIIILPFCFGDLGEYPVSIVSGFWHISSKHSVGKYHSWFKKTLRINAPTVFFYDEEAVKQAVQSHRQGLPTTFIQRPISKFHVFTLYNRNWTHKNNVPSPELGMIWLEKVSLINSAVKVNPYGSQWFAWVDAGICIYRNSPPPTTAWPLQSTLNSLPTSKIIYTGFWDKYHDVFGTAFLYHASVASDISSKFYHMLQQCTLVTDNWMCGSDQYILTLLKKRYPDMFFRVGGWYGEVVEALYSPLAQNLLASLNVTNEVPYLVASTMFLNESLYVKEWIDFHVRMGIENFLLYNHGSTDDYREVLRPYVTSRTVELRDAIDLFPDFCSAKNLAKTIKQKNCQIRVFNDAISFYAKKKARWLVIIDVDEFIYPPPLSKFRLKIHPVKQWLKENEDTDVIEVTAAEFGVTISHMKNNNSVSQFKYRAPLSKTKSSWNRLNFGHKSIGWPKKIRDNTVDRFICQNCSWKTLEPESNEMRMNHYQYKSAQHQNEKAKRNGNNHVKFDEAKQKIFTSEFDDGISTFFN